MEELMVLNKMTTNYKQALLNAYVLCAQANKKEIGFFHIFWGIYYEKGCLASEILRKNGINGEDKKKLILNMKEKITVIDIIKENSGLTLNQNARHMIVRSAALAVKYGHKYIGSEHLLYSLLKSEDEDIKGILSDNKVKSIDIIKHLDMILNSNTHFPDMTAAVADLKQRIKQRKKDSKGDNEVSLLDFFGTCLTDKDIQKNITPVIGREAEIRRMIQILSRKNKNNPMLLGEPGVGKTAIVEGLAKKILDKEVPDALLNKKLYSIDIALMVAGTSFRGEFEARIKQLVDEVRANPNIILFIDETHNIIGAGSASGAMDAANILKPALARGEIRCIGATTYDDYKKQIEPDTALCRRFQTVQVKEPTVEEAVKILKGIRRSFENHHRVIISDEAIEQAVYLSNRYMPTQFLPDKAIDLIDEAAARKRIEQPIDGQYKKLLEFEDKLKILFKQKQLLVSEEKYKQALDLKAEEIKLIGQIYEIEKKQLDKKDININRVVVGEDDIIQIVTEATKIDVPKKNKTKNNFNKVEQDLNRRIIGQKDAVSEMVSVLKRSAAGLSGDKRPLGSFIFMGPSGVGKSYSAEVLAEIVFPGKENLIRINMSEFGEKFNASKILGAPAGYVGYGEGGVLTENVKRNPYSVILFDEIEKAHPDIFNIFLQILEQGQLIDSKGRNINFKNTIIIMTSNIGLLKKTEKNSIGFDRESQDNIEQAMREKLEQFMRPEFLNRIDKVLVFNSLNNADIKRIVRLGLEDINSRIKKQGLNLRWSDKALQKLVQLCSQDDQGARQIRRVLQKHIEDPLADFILEHKPEENIKLAIDQDKIVLK